MNIVILHAWLCAKLNVKTDRGAGLAEYALLLVLIAVACIVSLTALKTSIVGAFTKISTELTTASS